MWHFVAAMCLLGLPGDTFFPGNGVKGMKKVMAGLMMGVPVSAFSLSSDIDAITRLINYSRQS